MITDTLAVILGGGQGQRLFPLTATRSKPAVPIGGKYRLIDVPVSLCLHAEIRRIFVLTQFNSASLNRHVSNTYRLDRFSGGFVEILAAEQTPDNPHWYQGTADAVRQAVRHITQHEARYYLILAGDHLYRMNYAELLDAHSAAGADITIAAQPVDPQTAAGMGVFRFDASGRIVAFEEKPGPDRLTAIGRSIPAGASFAAHSEAQPFMASMGVYVFSRAVMLDLLDREAGHDFGRELIPAALERYRVRPFLYRGYWADVGTIESFYEANVMLGGPAAPFRFWDPRYPIYSHLRHLPGSRLTDCAVRNSVVVDGSYLDRCRIEETVVGLRTHVRSGTRVARSVLLGADFYEEGDPPHGVPKLGIGRDAVLERVIVDKNARIGDGARLTNERGAAHADGDGYYIRGGIIVVPKGGVIAPGTVV
ncbi:MAG: glucose-1-phosphate adenylyltransferase [Acidobacteria bacterium RIFCSPLOWO2_12_FULL_68_19]|nr:MAG: glucose-1-phosphate adenylyltransferase [Acidobacteria bacterium RIFCSPLOWO2_12_FULL_68_19]